MNIFALSGILAGITSIVMAVVMFVKGRSRLHYLWGIFCMSVALWGFGGYKVATTIDKEMAILWWRIAYVGVILIPVLFTHFVYNFLKISNRWFITIIYCLGIFFLITNFINGLFIDKVIWVFDQFYYLSPPTPLYSLFVIFFFTLVIYSHIKLLKAYSGSTGITKNQIKYFFLGTAFGFAGGGTAFLTVYKTNFYPLLNITVFLYPIIIGYAISRYRLMNIKLITTQIFSAVIVLVTLVEIFNATSLNERITRVVIFLVALAFAILLIRSVLGEVRRREEMEKLAKQLAEASKKLKSANVELKKLDKAKSEFISIASHQLRTPLTAIKGYGAMLLDGDFGEVENGKHRDAIQKMFISNDRLIRLVENLLNISRIESGKIKFEFEDVQLVDLVSQVCDSLKGNAENRGLSLNFVKSKEKLPLVRIDEEKISQVINNFVDNAIKYTKKGGITVNVQKKNSSIVCCVKDTGIGIAEEDRIKLFKKFSRGKDSFKVNVEGLGLGLYVAQMMIEAHKGKIWVESEGEGKGSTFCFSLPQAGSTSVRKGLVQGLVNTRK